MSSIVAFVSRKLRSGDIVKEQHFPLIIDDYPAVDQELVPQDTIDVGTKAFAEFIQVGQQGVHGWAVDMSQADPEESAGHHLYRALTGSVQSHSFDQFEMVEHPSFDPAVDHVHLCPGVQSEGQPMILDISLQDQDMPLASHREAVGRCLEDGQGVQPKPLVVQAGEGDLLEIEVDEDLIIGQQPVAEKGIELIAALQKEANGKIIIMPGSGVKVSNIQ